MLTRLSLRIAWSVGGEEGVSRKWSVDRRVYVQIPHFMLSMLCRISQGIACSLRGLLRRNMPRRTRQVAENGLFEKGDMGIDPWGGQSEATKRAAWSGSVDGG